LHLADVADLKFEITRKKMKAGLGIDQLHDDTQLVANESHAALKVTCDPQPSPDTVGGRVG